MKKLSILMISSFLVIMVTLAGAFFSKKNKNYSGKTLRIGFYNVENLFDPYDDPTTNDDQFTPSNIKGWSNERYHRKYLQLSKAIIAMGINGPPDFLGLAEIENKKVLTDLIYSTPLLNWDMGIIHEDSPDERGIDVAAIYNRNTLTVINYGYYDVKFRTDNRPTRKILCACVKIKNNDTLFILVNHWPSRFGGQLESEEGRIDASNTLIDILDTLKKKIANPRIIIMGDFNDNPTDRSILMLTEKVFTTPNGRKSLIVNMSESIEYPGTLKFNAVWFTFDQILISDNLLPNPGKSCYIAYVNARVFHPDFLLCQDENFTGLKPFRTYSGSRYLGGFSDHLPVCIDVVLENR